MKPKNSLKQRCLIAREEMVQHTRNFSLQQQTDDYERTKFWYRQGVLHGLHLSIHILDKKLNLNSKPK